jgi:hypothetical protein
MTTESKLTDAELRAMLDEISPRPWRCGKYGISDASGAVVVSWDYPTNDGYTDNPAEGRNKAFVCAAPDFAEEVLALRARVAELEAEVVRLTPKPLKPHSDPCRYVSASGKSRPCPKQAGVGGLCFAHDEAVYRMPADRKAATLARSFPPQPAYVKPAKPGAVCGFCPPPSFYGGAVAPCPLPALHGGAHRHDAPNYSGGTTIPTKTYPLSVVMEPARPGDVRPHRWEHSPTNGYWLLRPVRPDCDDEDGDSAHLAPRPAGWSVWASRVHGSRFVADVATLREAAIAACKAVACLVVMPGPALLATRPGWEMPSEPVADGWTPCAKQGRDGWLVYWRRGDEHAVGLPDLYPFNDADPPTAADWVAAGFRVVT